MKHFERARIIGPSLSTFCGTQSRMLLNLVFVIESGSLIKQSIG
jgi:hypothetical protein